MTEDSELCITEQVEMQRRLDEDEEDLSENTKTLRSKADTDLNTLKTRSAPVSFLSASSTGWQNQPERE